MYNFNEDAIREAAYFIWKNNGCQANTSLSDWDAAINQLSAQAALKLKAPKKVASSVKVLMPKKTTVKASALRTAKSIILKPASAIKTPASSAKKPATKSVVVKAASKKAPVAKASCSKVAPAKTSLKKTTNKTTVAKKSNNKKSK